MTARFDDDGNGMLHLGDARLIIEDVVNPHPERIELRSEDGAIRGAYRHQATQMDTSDWVWGTDVLPVLGNCPRSIQVEGKLREDPEHGQVIELMLRSTTWGMLEAVEPEPDVFEGIRCSPAGAPMGDIVIFERR